MRGCTSPSSGALMRPMVATRPLYPRCQGLQSLWLLGVILASYRPALAAASARRAAQRPGVGVLVGTRTGELIGERASRRTVVCHQDDTWPFRGTTCSAHPPAASASRAPCVHSGMRPRRRPSRSASPFSHVSDRQGHHRRGRAGKSSVLHALELTGAPRWDYDSRNDMHWASGPWCSPLAAMNDDPMCFVDVHSGKMVHSFGPIVGPDGRRRRALLLDHTWHIHGPPLHLTGCVYRRHSRGQGSVGAEPPRRRDPMDIKDELGGVTLDGDRSSWSPATSTQPWRASPPSCPPRPGALASQTKPSICERKRRRSTSSSAGRSANGGWWAVAARRRGGVVARHRGSAGRLAPSGRRLVVLDTEPGVVVAVDAASGHRAGDSTSASSIRRRSARDLTRRRRQRHRRCHCRQGDRPAHAVTGEVRWRGPLTTSPAQPRVAAVALRVAVRDLGLRGSASVLGSHYRRDELANLAT